MISGLWYITPFTEIFTIVAIISGILIACGIASDLLIIYKTIWETIIGKALLLLMFAFATNLAYSVSSRAVNEIVKFDTSGLSYTVNFVAFLLVPIFIFIGASIIFAIVLVAGQIYLMIALHSEHLRNNKCLGSLIPKQIESYPGITFSARFVAYPVILGFLIASGSQATPAYTKFIERTAASFIFHVEAAHYSRCKTLPSERVIKVNDQEIVVVTNIDGAITFSPKKCVPVIDS